MPNDVTKKHGVKSGPIYAIIIGVIILALFTISGQFLRELFTAMCDNSCDLGAKFASYYAGRAIQFLLAITGIVTLVVGIVRLVKSKKK